MPECSKLPEGFVVETAQPSPPEYGAVNRDIDAYAKRLEAALYACNTDKQKLREWNDGTHND